MTDRSGCVVLRCCSQNFAVHIIDEQQVLKDNIDSRVRFCPFCGATLIRTIIDDAPFCVSNQEFYRLSIDEHGEWTTPKVGE